MADYQTIMSMVFKHQTYDEITRSLGCSCRDIAAVKKTISTTCFTAERFAAMTAKDIEKAFPDGRRTMCGAYADSHFAQVMDEMKNNRFFKLQQGWFIWLRCIWLH